MPTLFTLEAFLAYYLSGRTYMEVWVYSNIRLLSAKQVRKLAPGTQFSIGPSEFIVRPDNLIERII